MICRSCHKYDKWFFSSSSELMSFCCRCFKCRNKLYLRNHNQDIFHLGNDLQDHVYSSEITFNIRRQIWFNPIWSIPSKYFQEDGINMRRQMRTKVGLQLGGIRRGLWAQAVCCLPVHLQFQHSCIHSYSSFFLFTLLNDLTCHIWRGSREVLRKLCRMPAFLVLCPPAKELISAEVYITPLIPMSLTCVGARNSKL